MSCKFAVILIPQARAQELIIKKKPQKITLLGRKKNLAATYSPTLLCAVPLAMKGLTSEFGMGSGISPSLMPPRKKLICFAYKKQRLKCLHTQLMLDLLIHDHTLVLKGMSLPSDKKRWSSQWTD